MKPLSSILALLVFGCHSVSTPSAAVDRSAEYRDEIRQLDTRDTEKEVATRIAAGNWKFLAWYVDEPESTHIPGLTKEEGEKYIGSGRYQFEYYYDQRSIYALQYEGDIGPLIQGKYRYAEKFNRALLKAIQKDNRPNKPPLRMPVSGTPAADAPGAPPPGIAGR